MLDGPEYDGLDYRGVSVDYDGVDAVTGTPPPVRVGGGEAGTAVPRDLAERFDERVTRTTGTDSRVSGGFPNEQVSS